jgi:predicted ABC-type ATPase
MVKENHKPVLIVIAGPNGSGKTTITSKILKHEWLENALYINPDQVARMLNENGSAYLIDETKKFKQWILQMCSPETKLSASSDDTKK